MKVHSDSLWSWLVSAAAGLSMIIVCGGSYNFGLLLPPLMDYFNTTRQEAGRTLPILNAFFSFLFLFLF